MNAVMARRLVRRGEGEHAACGYLDSCDVNAQAAESGKWRRGV